MDELDYKNLDAKAYEAVDWLENTEIIITRNAQFQVIRAVMEYAYNRGKRSLPEPPKEADWDAMQKMADDE